MRARARLECLPGCYAMGICMAGATLGHGFAYTAGQRGTRRKYGFREPDGARRSAAPTGSHDQLLCAHAQAARRTLRSPAHVQCRAGDRPWPFLLVPLVAVGGLRLLAARTRVHCKGRQPARCMIENQYVTTSWTACPCPYACSHAPLPHTYSMSLFVQACSDTIAQMHARCPLRPLTGAANRTGPG